MRKEFSSHIYSPIRVGRWFLVTVASTGLFTAVSGQVQTQWSATETKAHIITNAVAGPMAQGNETIDIVVGLRIRNPDELTALRVSQFTPDNPRFGQWITPIDVLANYAPTAADAQAVATYLESHGFTNIQIASNRLLVSATGTTADVTAAFNTRLAHFTRDGQDAMANLDDAQVPTGLGSMVLSVLGLQTLDHASIAVVTTHDPVDFPRIYDASSLTAASSTAVGIVTEGNMTPVIADFQTFERNHGLSITNPTVVNVGGTSSDNSNLIEWDLDSQTIQAMAGALCNRCCSTLQRH